MHSTHEKMMARVIKELATKMVNMNTTLKDRRRLNVNQISGSRNSLILIVRLGQEEQRMQE
jgi:hypothetical protein